MVDLVSIDPGKRCIWVAAWVRGELVQVRGVAVESPPDLLRSWTWGAVPLAIEVPQIYQGKIQGKDQNDLVDLAICVGWCELACCGPVTRYRPREWKGQTSKKLDNKRTLKVLSEPEKAVIDASDIRPSLRHNILDAIGIGLRHLGRKYKGGK